MYSDNKYSNGKRNKQEVKNITHSYKLAFYGVLELNNARKLTLKTYNTENPGF